MKEFTIQSSQAMASLLQEKRVYFHRRLNRGRDLSKLTFCSELEIEPYTGLFVGGNLVNLGSFSYSNSLLPVGFRAGRYCSIGPNLTIGGYQHPVSAISSSIWVLNQQFSILTAYHSDYGIAGRSHVDNPQKPLPSIGHDVWIGRNVTLMGGVHVGDGAIVAQNSTVTKSVPPYAIVGGNPAKLIRMRFPPELVAALLEVQWWQYDFGQFAGLQVDKPQLFVDGLRVRKADLVPYRPKPLTASDLLSCAPRTDAT